MKQKIHFLIKLALVFLSIMHNGCADLEFMAEKNKSLGNSFDLSSRSILSKKLLDSTFNAESQVLKNIPIPESSNPQITQNSSTNFNYAFEATVSAESTYPGYSVQKIKDGDTNITVGPSFSWTNNFPSGGTLPESVFLKFSSLRRIDRINIYTSLGYELQNYRVQYRVTTTGSWLNLVQVSGNRSAIKSHNLNNPIDLLELRIICEMGPPDQIIYGRLNEVQLFGPPEPTLPTIQTENGILVFGSQDEVIQTLDYLEYKYAQYDDAFLSQYPNLTDDEIASIEESTGYNDAQPYINFENQFRISSKRAQISAAEDNWLASTSADYPNQYENPDYNFIEDDEVRTVVNSLGEIKVGLTYYIFNADGTYYEVPSTYYNEVVELRTRKDGDPLPAHTIHNQNTSFLIFPNSCRSSERIRDRKTNGDWRIDHITSIWNHPWRSRLMAKTKSYKKIGGRWKKRRSTIGAQVWGTVRNNNCEGSEFLQSSYVSKRRRKVKSYVSSGITIRANSGDIQSLHFGGNVGNFTVTLAW